MGDEGICGVSPTESACPVKDSAYSDVAPFPDDDLPDDFASVILTVKDLLTAALFLSVAVSLNVNVPAFVGVPDSVALLPEYVSFNPVGIVPEFFHV